MLTAIDTVSDGPAALPRLKPGACVGPNRIERLPGKDGMGEVHEAGHTEQGRGWR